MYSEGTSKVVCGIMSLNDLSHSRFTVVKSPVEKKQNCTGIVMIRLKMVKTYIQTRTHNPHRHMHTSIFYECKKYT